MLLGKLVHFRKGSWIMRLLWLTLGNATSSLLCRCHLFPGYVVPRTKVAYAQAALLQPQASAFAVAYSRGKAADNDSGSAVVLVYD